MRGGSLNKAAAFHHELQGDLSWFARLERKNGGDRRMYLDAITPAMLGILDLMKSCKQRKVFTALAEAPNCSLTVIAGYCRMERAECAVYLTRLVRSGMIARDRRSCYRISWPLLAEWIVFRRRRGTK